MLLLWYTLVYVGCAAMHTTHAHYSNGLSPLHELYN
jgi:hypothetical protein